MLSTTRPGIANLPLLLALLGALPLGCGSVDSISGIAPDEAPRQLAEAICPKAYDCCMPSQLMDNEQAGTDVASCETKTQAAFQQQVASIKASQKKGRLIYDGLKVQGCVDFLHSATCADVTMTGHFSGLPACSSFIQPQVVVGGACGSDLECVGGFCDRSALPSGSIDDGVCKAFAKVDEACSASALCATDLTCDAAAKTCKAPPPPKTPAPATACFYTSGCQLSGGERGAASLLAIGLLAVAMARRRRAR